MKQTQVELPDRIKYVQSQVESTGGGEEASCVQNFLVSKHGNNEKLSKA